ncbi:hypothetical protein [uncultured Algibacter sp.]|uniref:hypothetical protein n=1 Tax=uncultured Algibacter sp. TaxID=298659 RepID=UPI0026338F95|nr:hypothetical protein [uncultured Algibacter sp.]
MKSFKSYTKFIPYLYFIAATIFCFTMINKSEGLIAYPVLLFGIPFVWQLFKPRKDLNFTLGITFVCISSYLIFIYISDSLNIISISQILKRLMVYSGLFVFANFVMSLWIIRNSLKETF